MAGPELDALVLAAGLGTRLRPLTERIPKALLPIYGVPLLDYHLERLLGTKAACPVSRVVVNGHHLASALRSHLVTHPYRERLAFSYEPEIRGTGGAIARAAPRLRSDPFLVLNAKALMPDPPLEEALALHRRGRVAASMVLVRAPAWANVWVDGERVTEIRRGERDARAWAFTGVHLVGRDLATRLPPEGFHDIRDTYDRLAADGRLGALCWDLDASDSFLAVESPRDYLEAHRACAGDGARRFGLLPAGPQRIHPVPGYGYIDAEARVGIPVTVEESVVLPDASVHRGVALRRCIVGPGARVTAPARNRLITADGEREIE
jgi:NDP-sugar pyrophosphorylase family protein